jgi:phosphoribosylanthranilate isomerase
VFELIVFMTWVKICGITNLEDALVAAEAGADAVGFVFYEKSPRNITPEKAREIVNQLPEEIEKVGVVVANSESAIDVLRVTHTAGLTAIQQHLALSPLASVQSGVATDRDLFPKRFQVFISLPAALVTATEQGMTTLVNSVRNIHREVPDRTFVEAGAVETFFLDSGNPAQPGGTGEPFDWKKAVPLAEGMRQGGLKLVVAGGLTPENVGEAIGILHPWGVDVSSRVELRPGKKDPDKVRAFVKAVREADKANSN